MKKYLAFPLLALVGGGAAFLLRLLQNRNGFEPDTGLAVPGDPWGLLLVVLLALIAAACFLLARKLPAETPAPAFPEGFALPTPGLLTLGVMGVFLLAASGLLDLLAGFGLGGSESYALSAAGMVQLTVRSTKVHLVLGVLALLSAVGLFPALAACRKKETPPEKPFNCNLLLIPVVGLVVRLVLMYRENSVDPALAAYYVELLALSLLTLALYRLSSFAFLVGRTRRFAVYSVLAVVLCLATLADGHSLPDTLFYAGGALVALGFLLQRLMALARPWDSL